MSIQIEEIRAMVEDVLNEQASLLWEWRTIMHRFLSKPLSDDDNDGETAHGQEYQATLDDQGEVETYMQAYGSLLADHREAVHSERTLLAAHDSREKKIRQTKAALKATANDDGIEIATTGIELQPEHEVLLVRLSDQRKGLIKALHGRAVKSIITDLTEMAMRTKDNDPEKVILDNNVKVLRGFLNDHSMIRLCLF